MNMDMTRIANYKTEAIARRKTGIANRLLDIKFRKMDESQANIVASIEWDNELAPQISNGTQLKFMGFPHLSEVRVGPSLHQGYQLAFDGIILPHKMSPEQTLELLTCACLYLSQVGIYIIPHSEYNLAHSVEQLETILNEVIREAIADDSDTREHPMMTEHIQMFGNHDDEEDEGDEGAPFEHTWAVTPPNFAGTTKMDIIDGFLFN